MHSKPITWLYLFISIAILPISSWIFKMIWPFHTHSKILTDNLYSLFPGEIMWIVIILLLNHFFIKQKLSFKVNAKDVVLPFIVTIGIIFAMTRTTMSQTHYSHPVIIGCLIGSFALFVGFFEETLCRGIMFPKMLSTFKNVSLKNVYLSVIGSSLLFGGMHLMNLTRQSLLTTLVQVVFALSIGSFLCAFYVRSGALWMPMAIHALWDFNSMFYKNTISDSPIKSVWQGEWIAIFMFIFFVGLMFILLRPQKLKNRLVWLTQISNH